MWILDEHATFSKVEKNILLIIFKTQGDQVKLFEGGHRKVILFYCRNESQEWYARTDARVNWKPELGCTECLQIPIG